MPNPAKPSANQGGDELEPTANERRAGRQPRTDIEDRPDQNHTGDESAHSQHSDSRGLGDLDGNRSAGSGKARGPDEP